MNVIRHPLFWTNCIHVCTIRTGWVGKVFEWLLQKHSKIERWGGIFHHSHTHTHTHTHRLTLEKVSPDDAQFTVAANEETQVFIIDKDTGELHRPFPNIYIHS